MSCLPHPHASQSVTVPKLVGVPSGYDRQAVGAHLPIRRSTAPEAVMIEIFHAGLAAVTFASLAAILPLAA